jgi:hypothetical protein
VYCIEYIFMQFSVIIIIIIIIGENMAMNWFYNPEERQVEACQPFIVSFLNTLWRVYINIYKVFVC